MFHWPQNGKKGVVCISTKEGRKHAARSSQIKLESLIKRDIPWRIESRQVKL